MILTFVIFLIVFVCGATLEYRNKSPFLLFYAGLFILAIYPSFINSVPSIEKNYQDIIYVQANIFSSLYLLSFILSRLVFIKIFKIEYIWTEFFENKSEKNYSDLNILYIMILPLCFIFFVIGLKLFSLSAFMSLNWWDLVRANNKFVLSATYLSYASCGILIAAQYSKDLFLKKVAYIITFLFIIFSVFVLKTRSYVLMFIVPIFLYYMYSTKGIKRIKPVIVALTTAFVFILARAVRHSTDLNEFLTQNFIESFFDASEGAETTFIDAFYYFIHFRNDFTGFEENITLKRILLFWYPYFKPIEFSYLMHSAYFGSSTSENLSMHPTVFGDAYANAWWFGAFVYSIFLAVYISILESTVRFFGDSKRHIKVIVFSIVSITSLIFARGAIYNAFMYSLLPIFLLISIVFIFNNILKSRFLK